MRLKYRPMMAEEFTLLIEKKALEGYITDIEVYKNEFIKQSRGKTPREFAEEQFKQILPLGVSTPNNYFWFAINEKTNEEIGYIWFTIMPEKKLSLLSYILVYKQFQGQGFGTEMLTYWEHYVKRSYPELDGVYLHVFKHNPRAKQLYERIGFSLLHESFEGWNMIKKFQRD
ncbi:MAG: GNAT family N-acetyltransferase [Candidatus Lokiarchaeota archaeon]|nr:GNAT family N-acetyltransferase [Candidatus Lokiarchaeota archaeon]